MAKLASSLILSKGLFHKLIVLFFSIKCWSTLPKWERDNWMNVQPSKHFVLINGYTHQGQWYEGDSRLSFRDPYALAECWRSYFNNQILEVIQVLWKDYHFILSTDRIFVFGRRPYDTAICNLRRIEHTDPRNYLTSENPKYEPLLYCWFCNQYAIYPEHECNDDPPWDPYDGYPSNAPNTN